MFQQLVRILTCILLFLAITTTNSCVNAQGESYTPEKNITFATLLDEKIEHYRHIYPEIAFLILQGDDELLQDMMALDLVLGYQPMSLDYEHPVELREDLIFASVERIWFMLKSRMPSASLFKADTPLGWQEHVCVLTINPQEIATDSISATQHLLDLPEEVIQKIPHDMQLPANDYLAFVIDHEIYHCLKSMYVGPQLMSHKELWSGYNQFREEQGADAYALGMHIKTRDIDSIFAKNILRIRGMSLYNADPDHLTCKALEQVLKVPSENITEMSSNEIFDLANSIKNRLTTSYDEYIQYLASAVQAMSEIGKDELVSDELRNNLKDIQPDSAQVKELVENARCCRAELCGDQLKP